MSDQHTNSTRRPVLVPIDFSPCSQAALIFACYFAQRIESPLLILHVVHEPVTKPGYYRKHDQTQRMLPIDDVASGMLRKFLDSLQEQEEDLPREILRDAQTMLVKGLPEERIPEVATRTDAAMIIMGSHGRKGIARLLLGSVAEQVTKYSQVPVTIIKAPNEKAGDSAANRMGAPEWWKRAHA